MAHAAMRMRLAAFEEDDAVAELHAELRDARAEVAQRAHEQQARTQAQARLAESAAYEQVAAAEMKWRDTVGGFQRGSNLCA